MPPGCYKTAGQRSSSVSQSATGNSYLRNRPIPQGNLVKDMKINTFTWAFIKTCMNLSLYLTRLIQAKFVVDFAVPSCKGDMCWRPRVFSDVGPGSGHKSCNLSSFPDLYFNTICFLLDINPKSSHLSCA